MVPAYPPSFTMLMAIYLITLQGKYLDVQNSDSDFVTSCFARILISITRNLLLCFVLGFLAALIHLQVVQEF